MCNMIITKEKMNLEFVVYNLVFSDRSGRITIESIAKQLENRDIKNMERKIESIFRRWNEQGIIFDNGNEYLVNTMR